MGGACLLTGPIDLAPPLLKFIHLLHLNQAGVQHLISNLTNTLMPVRSDIETKVFLMSGWMVALSTERFS